MSELEQQFLENIFENTADPFPALVYADWLEEQGQDSRARYFRLFAREPASRLRTIMIHPWDVVSCERKDLELTKYGLLYTQVTGSRIFHDDWHSVYRHASIGRVFRFRADLSGKGNYPFQGEEVEVKYCIVEKQKDCARIVTVFPHAIVTDRSIYLGKNYNPDLSSNGHVVEIIFPDD